MEKDDQAYTIMIEMLGWYCRDFIVVTIHVFQRAIVNALEIDGKVESLSRDREDILKRYGIIRTEKYSKWKKEKNLTGWFNSKEEINFKKLYRASRNYGKITKCWTFKDFVKECGAKNIWRNNGPEYCAFSEKCIHTDWGERTWNRVNMKEIHI